MSIYLKRPRLNDWRFGVRYPARAISLQTSTCHPAPYPALSPRYSRPLNPHSAEVKLYKQVASIPLQGSLNGALISQLQAHTALPYFTVTESIHHAFTCHFLQRHRTTGTLYVTLLPQTVQHTSKLNGASVISK